METNTTGTCENATLESAAKPSLISQDEQDHHQPQQQGITIYIVTALLGKEERCGPQVVGAYTSQAQAIRNARVFFEAHADTFADGVFHSHSDQRCQQDFSSHLVLRKEHPYRRLFTEYSSSESKSVVVAINAIRSCCNSILGEKQPVPLIAQSWTFLDNYGPPEYAEKHGCQPMQDHTGRLGERDSIGVHGNSQIAYILMSLEHHCGEVLSNPALFGVFFDRDCAVEAAKDDFATEREYLFSQEEEMKIVDNTSFVKRGEVLTYHSQHCRFYSIAMEAVDVDQDCTVARAENRSALLEFCGKRCGLYVNPKIQDLTEDLISTRSCNGCQRQRCKRDYCPLEWMREGDRQGLCTNCQASGTVDSSLPPVTKQPTRDGNAAASSAPAERSSTTDESARTDCDHPARDKSVFAASMGFFAMEDIILPPSQEETVSRKGEAADVATNPPSSTDKNLPSPSMKKTPGSLLPSPPDNTSIPPMEPMNEESRNISTRSRYDANDKSLACPKMNKQSQEEETTAVTEPTPVLKDKEMKMRIKTGLRSKRPAPVTEEKKDVIKFHDSKKHKLLGPGVKRCRTCNEAKREDQYARKQWKMRTPQCIVCCEAKIKTTKMSQNKKDKSRDTRRKIKADSSSSWLMNECSVCNRSKLKFEFTDTEWEKTTRTCKSCISSIGNK